MSQLQNLLPESTSNNLLRYRKAAEQARDTLRGKLPVSTSDVLCGGQISLSINSDISPGKASLLSDTGLAEDVEVTRLVRRTKIEVEWQPESTWLKTDISHPASTNARQDVPEIVSYQR